MADCADLTTEMWSNVLQYVPTNERLSSCALVSQQFSRAAAAATHTLLVDAARSTERRDTIMSWINLHGWSLKQLTLLGLPRSIPTFSIRQLPCHNLQQLALWGNLSIQLGASSMGAGILHSCTALTKLITKLQHLKLIMHDHGSAEHPLALATRVVPHLASLTLLDVTDDGDYGNATLTKELAPHISKLVELQVLNLQDTGTLDWDTLPRVESLTALTKLNLGCYRDKLCSLPDDLAEIGPHLKAEVLHLSCLSNWKWSTHLQELHLDQFILKPSSGHANGGSQLLLMLVQLPALRVLRLTGCLSQWPQDPAKYSALTTSSQLRELSLDCYCNIPTEAWLYAFTYQHQLPHMHSLCTFDDDSLLEVGNKAYVHGDPHWNPPCFSAAGVAALARSCPAMQDLTISVQEGAQGQNTLLPLRSLTALSGLWLDGLHSSSIHAYVAGWEQLRSLRLSLQTSSSDILPFQDLVPLAALTNLTKLAVCEREQYLHDTDEDDSYVTDEKAFRLLNKAADGSPPDVWSQLLQRCAAQRQAQSAVISTMLVQLQQTCTKVSQLEQQQLLQRDQAQQQQILLEQHMQAAAAAKTEAAEAKAQAVSAESKAAAASSRAAELEARVQALERKLQAVLSALQQD